MGMDREKGLGTELVVQTVPCSNSGSLIVETNRIVSEPIESDKESPRDRNSSPTSGKWLIYYESRDNS